MQELKKSFKNCLMNFLELKYRFHFLPESVFTEIVIEGNEALNSQSIIDGTSFSSILRQYKTFKSIYLKNFDIYDLDAFQVQSDEYSIEFLSFDSVRKYDVYCNESFLNMIIKICTHENIKSSLKKIRFENYQYFSHKEYEQLHQTLKELGIEVEIPGLEKYNSYQKEINEARNWNQEYENIENLKENSKETDNFDEHRYKARHKYIELSVKLLEHWKQGYYYSFIFNLNGINDRDLKDKDLKKLREDLLKEFQVWCSMYKKIVDQISEEGLEQLSRWDIKTDQTFIKIKEHIEKMAEKYKQENKYVDHYFQNKAYI